MNFTMKKSRWVLPALLAGSLAFSGISFAQGGFGKAGHGGEGMLDRFYHMADMLDMTDAQEQQLTRLIENAKSQMEDEEHPRLMMKEFMMDVKPGDANYEIELNKLADKAAATARKKVLVMGQLRKEVDALLTEDQRQALEAKMQRMMKRMEKRMEQRESMRKQ